jgi:hypothetical protein
VRLLAKSLRTDVFKCGPDEPQSCEVPPKPANGGTKDWQAIYGVLTSPRCMNCHPVVSSKLPLVVEPRQEGEWRDSDDPAGKP